MVEKSAFDPFHTHGANITSLEGVDQYNRECRISYGSSY